MKYYQELEKFRRLWCDVCPAEKIRQADWLTTQILEGSVLHFAAPAPPFQLFLGNIGGTFELPPMKMRIKFLSRLQ